MHENSEISVNSAQASRELHQKREKESLRKEAAANKTTQLASEQVALLKEANDLAYLEAQEAKIESKKSFKMALWSIIIAAVSLLVAAAQYV